LKPSAFSLLKPKALTMKVTCTCCRFFCPKSVNQRRNECHRHSPAPRLAADGRHDEFAVGIWPAVSPGGWCGEFKRQIITRQANGVGTNGGMPR
jgi:hypothetical protein